MELQQMTCGGCGARLSVVEDANFVDCRHCGASLRVERTDSAIVTKINDRVRAVEDELSELQKLRKLQELEARWAATRASYRVSGDVLDGRQMRRQGNVVLGVSAAGTLLLSVFGFVALGGRSSFVYLSLVPALMMLAFGFAAHQRLQRQALQYFAAEEEYLRERAELTQSR